ncbi:hypothetical protein [Amycolatopsis sp. NPDC004169]|uniref:hypothetical protein n=1 Tax=Amycolatopsis sp. NPDC004169 TaxID=3154453 RepID=UPI0033A70186
MPTHTSRPPRRKERSACSNALGAAATPPHSSDVGRLGPRRRTTRITVTTAAAKAAIWTAMPALEPGTRPRSASTVVKLTYTATLDQPA